MSEELEVFPISKVEGSRPHDDGKTMLLHLSQPTGEKMVLALPVDQLMSLIQLSAIELSRGQAFHGQGGAKDVKTFKASWFQLSKDAKTNDVILSLTFEKDAVLHFVLQGQIPVGMRDTLQIVTGQSIPQKPDKPLN